MLVEIDEILQKIEKFYSEEAEGKIEKLISDMHPADIAHIASHLDDDYRGSFLTMMVNIPNLEEIIHELDESIIIEFIRVLSDEQISYIFSLLNADDMAHVLTALPEDLYNSVIEVLPERDSERAETLLEYEEEEAGRIMSLKYFTMHEDDTVLDAFNTLKKAPDAETVYYIYITDDRLHLVGVVTLRELLTKQNHLQMKEIMNEDVISVSDELDQEKVALLVERYNLNAIPVVDQQNKIKGIITVDDIIDVIREEATEDIMKLAGTSDEEYSQKSAFHGFMLRMPWLLVSFFGGMLTIQSMSYFTLKISHVVLLAFVPIIGGMGGNIGSQSSTIIVRGLATGKILVSELWEVVIRELKTAVLLGLFFGTFLGLAAEVQFRDVQLIGVMVAMGLLFSMLIAAAIGSIIPILFQKFDIDPAIATGPFVSTTIDNLGVVGYLGITLYIMKYYHI